MLVVTEGEETEPQYVEGLNNELRSSFAVPIVKRIGVGSDPLRVVEACIRERDEQNGSVKAYDTCVVLVDVDTHHRLEQAVQLAEREGIIAIITNLKFEVWLRWHFEDNRSVLDTHQLDRRMKDLGVFARKKTLSPRFPYAAVNRAVATAKQADQQMAAGRAGPNPSSAMPLLVDILCKG